MATSSRTPSLEPDRLSIRSGSPQSEAASDASAEYIPTSPGEPLQGQLAAEATRADSLFSHDFGASTVEAGAAHLEAPSSPSAGAALEASTATPPEAGLPAPAAPVAPVLSSASSMEQILTAYVRLKSDARWVFRFDGATVDYQGPKWASGAAAVLYLIKSNEGMWDSELEEICAWFVPLSPTDSFESEFVGLFLAVEKATQLGIRDVRIEGDNAAVVGAVDYRHPWNVPAQHVPTLHRISELIKQIQTFRVPRRINSGHDKTRTPPYNLQADSLAGRAAEAASEGAPAYNPSWCAPRDQDCQQYRAALLDQTITATARPAIHRDSADLMAGERGSLETLIPRGGPQPLTPWELAMRPI